VEKGVKFFVETETVGPKKRTVAKTATTPAAMTAMTITTRSLLLNPGRPLGMELEAWGVEPDDSLKIELCSHGSIALSSVALHQETRSSA
jgi:hypothetical protein